MTLRNGIKAALDADINYLEVEVDKQILNNTIKGFTHAPWQIQTLIQHIKLMILRFQHISFTHIYCETNITADWIAKYD